MKNTPTMTDTNKEEDFIRRIVNFLVATAMKESHRWDFSASPQDAWKFQRMHEMSETIARMSQEPHNGTDFTQPTVPCCSYCYREIDLRLYMLVGEVDNGLRFAIPSKIREPVKKHLMDVAMEWDHAWHKEKHRQTHNV